MRIKVSDYVAQFAAEHGVKTIFTVVGGGAMHLNDSFGHCKALHCVYNHHEQASAMAAEAYFRVNNELAGLCVTSGPGAINALNGVAGAYQDSIPMMVFSGQTKTALMTVNSGLDLRTLGNQEFDIMSTLDKVTKYAVTVMDAADIRYYLEKAFFLAMNGRPGPCWLEIPIDIQGAIVETDTLRGYEETLSDEAKTDSSVEVHEKIRTVIEKLKHAKRPVIYAGNGIRVGNAKGKLDALLQCLNIPVVTCWDSVDVMETDDKCYAGRGGTMGDRAGNFTVQNSDLVLAIGNRLSIYQVGYQLESWAREAYVVDVDIDELELKKQTIRVDLPICCDAGIFLSELREKLEEDSDVEQNMYGDWIEKCNYWKEKYPVVQSRHYNAEGLVNVYAFVDTLSKSLPEGMITVVANGSASVVGSAAYYIKKEQRFLMNCAMSSMGYELPAAVGACVANDAKPIVCLAGDGSIMMNLQELQTIVTNHLPIKLVLINNDGYQQIRLTQTNLFHKNFVGIGPESRDLGFPDFSKLANAFGIPYYSCTTNEKMTDAISWLNKQEQYCMLEIFCSTDQIFEPKSATKRLEDGSLYSPPLEDLAPFLPREELKSNMIIKMWDER